jgi:hypothetical protein
MRAVLVVVANILREETFQVAFVNCNDVIQEITAATPYPTLCDSILPRTFERGADIREVLAAPRSPCQNSYAERLIGSIRRECLDHVIVFHQAGLRRILKDYFEYYERCRTHLSLDKDAPVSRPVEPPSIGHVIEIPKVGGLHHLYARQAA